MNGEMNGSAVESMDPISPQLHSPVGLKNIEDKANIQPAHNHYEDSNTNDNSNSESSNSDDSQSQNDNSNTASSVNNENSNCRNEQVFNAYHCSNSSDSTESSQKVPNDKPTNHIKNNVQEIDSEKEEKTATNDEESEDEVDSEEDSSSDEGSEGTEPKAEDTVSIKSDSEGDSHQDKHKDQSSKAEQNGEDSSHGSEIHEIHDVSDNDDCVVTDDSKKEAAEVNTRRRSNRVVNRKNYAETEKDDIENGDGDEDESDIEEISAEDPLNHQAINRKVSKPIVVNDTKTLVEMASKSKSSSSSSNQKKEPTVVIIDTNSILAGKGPVPLPQKSAPAQLSPTSSQNLYQSIAARGTTVTPVSMKNSSNNPTNNASSASAAPIILPSLTDDMFVVEAPSFIVPYVYEKPSVKPFREFVDILGRELEEKKLKEEAERKTKEKEEKGEEDRSDKEDEEKVDEKDGDADSEKKEKKDGVEAMEVDETKTEKDAEKDLEEEDDQKKKKGRKRRKEEDDDVSWDGESSSDSDEDALSDHPKTVVIKEKDDDSLDGLKEAAGVDLASDLKTIGIKTDSYFDNTLGKFFITIGLNMVQEYVQHDLLKQQRRKHHKEVRSGTGNPKASESAIVQLLKNLEFSKENNAPYIFKQHKCEFCSFKTESMLAMSHHMETPHMKNNVYKCNFCAFEIRSPHDILYHMEAEHNVRGRLERAPAYHQCPNCPFEDNGKSKLARHQIACAKKYKPELNLAPPIEWEPPAKIPKISRARNNMVSSYQAAFNRAQMNPVGLNRPMMTNPLALNKNFRPGAKIPNTPPRPGAPLTGAPVVRGGLVIRQNTPTVILPANYPITQTSTKTNSSTPKMLHQPSISITPLPRAPQPTTTNSSQPKGTFVICEICDGYIKDLEQLRNHMQWIHKVKIHPKMIYNRPPLNCQKCQFRFFTDQGLERHLLGSHGLVTSSMQEAANKGKDAGRCPVCGRVYQWKLLNHVARDHNLTLKPAHLSYKCTVCTATFGMYKQFENHVYSAHSVVAKRVMDKNKTSATPATGKTTSTGESLLKPIKINDEITIIPQSNKAASNSVNKTKKD